MLISRFEHTREFPETELRADYVIAGGGLTGVCSAITAARQGIQVILVQDRPVLGGNASSEIRIWALGATSHMGNNNRWSREGGVIDEILVENNFRNKEGNPILFDMVLMDKVLAEPNITLLLNTTVYGIEKGSDRSLTALKAFNSQTGTEYKLTGTLFADCTGDGTVAFLTGASFRIGAEEHSVYGEGFAPDTREYGELMGHSILFYVRDTGRPVKYIAPDFALKDAEKYIPKLQNPNYFNISQHGCKYWWLEYGGRLDTIGDTEKIKYELWRIVYGVWDYMKNSGKFPQTENLTLEWVGTIPGKRESRRFCGHYTISQKDIIEQRRHYDAVAYGGWAIDLHPADGVYSPKNGCNQWHSKGIYQIPYRCYVSTDLENLFIGGRIMSSSHVANGSTRVMCTSAHGGQAIGMAAALCIKERLLPENLMEPEKMLRLQAELIKTGQFIPDLALHVGNGLADRALLSVSSEFMLSSLPADGSWFQLEYPAAQLLPVTDQVPVIKLTLRATEYTELTVCLRSSTRRGNFTPDQLDRRLTLSLKPGDNEVILDFACRYDSPRYVFICFMANAQVQLPQSDMLVSGITAVFNHMNPAVSNFGRQTPPSGIGVDEFEFWCPKRRPEARNFAMTLTPALHGFGLEGLRNSYYRPYISPNGWIPAADDPRPTLTIRWDRKQTISRIRLFFDTDADQALESVQMGHYDSVMPCCIRNYVIKDASGGILAEVKGNYQTRNDIVLNTPIHTDLITVEIDRPQTDIHAALMGVIVA